MTSREKSNYIDSLRLNICHNYQTYIFRDTAEVYIKYLENKIERICAAIGINADDIQ